MKTLRQKTDQSYRELCPLARLPYSTFMRWQERVGRGEEVICLRGPRLPALNREQEEELTREIAHLRHRRVRTTGTGALYRLWKGRISRRELQRRVKDHRQKLQRRKRAEMTRIRWLVPGAVWAMDDTGTCRKGKIHHVRDAASRYDLTLLPATSLPGKEVARNLKELIDRHGPPLVAKRDNGSNLNDRSVNEVLERYRIIPLNSPPYYPRYNGQIERGQREVGEILDDFPVSAPSAAFPEREQRLRSISEALNRRPRPCLGGRTAEEVFKGGREKIFWYTQKRRKAALQHIRRMSAEIVEREGLRTKRALAAAWRRAVETWLLQEGIIAIEKGGSVTPFPSILVS